MEESLKPNNLAYEKRDLLLRLKNLNGGISKISLFLKIIDKYGYNDTEKIVNSDTFIELLIESGILVKSNGEVLVNRTHTFINQDFELEKKDLLSVCEVIIDNERGQSLIQGSIDSIIENKAVMFSTSINNLTTKIYYLFQFLGLTQGKISILNGKRVVKITKTAEILLLQLSSKWSKKKYSRPLIDLSRHNSNNTLINTRDIGQNARINR